MSASTVELETSLLEVLEAIEITWFLSSLLEIHYLKRNFSRSWHVELACEFLDEPPKFNYICLHLLIVV